MTQTKETQLNMTAEKALQLLKEGNLRFVNNQRLERDLTQQVATTGNEGQFPHSVVLNCIDSRVTAEYLFDQGVGDVFSARVAGNFANTDIIGSMEFAVLNAGVKLIVVLGHTQCGAVKGTCDFLYKPEGEKPNLAQNLITMASENLAATAQAVANNYPGDHTSSNGEFIQHVADENVHVTIAKILDESPAIKKAIDQSNGELKIVGAMYDVKNGAVTWM